MDRSCTGKLSQHSTASALVVLAGSLILSCGRDQLIAVSEAPSTSSGTSTSSDASGGGGASNSDRENGGKQNPSSGGGATQTSSTPPSTGGHTGTCALNEQPCNNPSDCCSENCVNAKCASRPTCSARGSSCNSPTECCSKICTEGRCLEYTGCGLIGEPCTSSADCCSSACADTGTGERKCQGLDGCRTLGELCTKGGVDGECCSGTCTTDVATGLKRCALGTDASCLHVGELCDGDSGMPCCDDQRPQQDPRDPTPQVQPAICFPTAMGRSRCLAKSPTTCFEQDSPCRLAGECCVPPHYCTPSLSGSNALTCKLENTIEQLVNAPCRASRDCRLGEACFGIGGTEGVCKTTGLDCRQLGQTCVDAPDSCCSGRCSTDSHTCIVSD